MNQMNSLSTITLLPENKSQIKIWVQKAKEELTNGYYNPLEVAIRLKIAVEAFEQVSKDENVKHMISNELAKYPEKTIEFMGAKITKSARKTWKFDLCNDSVYSDLLKQSELLKEQLKQRETFLQSLREPVANIETGEEIYPASFTEIEVVSITLPK